MPEPIIADHWRAQFALQGKSGLPEDQYVNTFVFRNDAIGATRSQVGDNIRQFLRDAYDVAHQPSAVSVASLLAGGAVTNEATIKVYDLGQAPPREPLIYTETLATLAGATAMPEELAACISYYADRNLPRQRGRIYIGPLESGLSDATGNTGVRIGDLLKNALVGMGVYLVAGNANLTWTLLSRADAVTRVVTDGWVDDAFDIQRRRGVAPSTRTRFTAAGPVA